MGRGILLLNRELSWLSFNGRVLQEAADSTVPLLERIRFLGIYSNNRDEFFRVRVATVKRLLRFSKKLDVLQGEQPAPLMEKIQREIIRQQHIFDSIYNTLLKDLSNNHIRILDESQITNLQGNFVKEYFESKVRPLLFPVFLDNAPHFPYLTDKSIYLTIKLTDSTRKKKTQYALIEIPRKGISRFLLLPSKKATWDVMLLDDVIRYCLKDLFYVFGYDKVQSHVIKITRDAELDIDNDLSRSYVEKIFRSIKNRKKGAPVRLAYDKAIPRDMLNYLVSKMKFRKTDNLIPGGRTHNFKDFISFPNVGPVGFRYKRTPPVAIKGFNASLSAFNPISKSDQLLFFPYNSYNHVLDILREASIDPKVVSIHITLYRVAQNSIVANALVNALKNGKSVTAVVELQARFDEESNIYWAERLQDEGAHVIFGVPGLKVHSKLFLITRKESGKLTKYAHIGTGNFNEATANVYSDISFLTKDERITDEVEKLFGFYKNNYKTGHYKHLVVAPWDMRKKFINLINKEIQNAKNGLDAYIILKLNSIVDEEVISKLYVASSSGVKIRMIVRGICSIAAGIKGLSENIEITSIVDKYLEHSRIFIFANGGEEKYFISSADFMSRNFDNRSEVAVPIYDERLKRLLRVFINLQIEDNTKARILDINQHNKYVSKGKAAIVRSQDDFYKELRRFS
ncbi:MAG: polyphosphate kinase 1 [Bacteroidota bacterium]|jgi:polyphosphate kinase